MILEIVTDQGVMNGGSEEKVTVTSERSDARLFVTSIPPEDWDRVPEEGDVDVVRCRIALLDVGLNDVLGVGRTVAIGVDV